MTRRSKLKIGFGVGVLAALGFLWAVPFFQRYGFELNDSQTGLQMYVRNPVESEFKEGYLERDTSHRVARVNLRDPKYIRFALCNGTGKNPGVFEVWSDVEQPHLSIRNSKGVLSGPRIRLELCAKKIDPLKGEVWFIKQNLGPVP